MPYSEGIVRSGTIMEALTGGKKIPASVMKKYIINRTTNGAYGSFYKYMKLRDLLSQEEPQWQTLNQEYGSFTQDLRAPGESAHVRHAVGVSGSTTNQHELVNTRDASPASSGKRERGSNSIQGDKTVLKLPPIDERYLPKGGRHVTVWPQKAPLKTPNTWWAENVSPRPPPPSGYAKRYMKTNHTRLWDNMEYLAGRAVPSRPHDMDTNILNLEATQGSTLY